MAVSCVTSGPYRRKISLFVSYNVGDRNRRECSSRYKLQAKGVIPERAFVDTVSWENPRRDAAELAMFLEQGFSPAVKRPVN